MSASTKLSESKNFCALPRSAETWKRRRLAMISRIQDATGFASTGDDKRQHRREKRDVHGWLVLDKQIGMTSTHAVSVVKRLFQARRVGHAGTLDPLASGCLPIALGEATKTVAFVMEGRKVYRFTVRWGEERDTDDAEGRITESSAERPT